MKKTSRIIAIVLCLVLAVSALSGCTIKLNINVNNTGSVTPANNTTVAPATTAPATTAAPASTAAPDATPDASKPADKPDDSKPADDKPAAAELSASSSKEDIVAEYVKVYNTTKKAGTFTGHDTMALTSVLIDGKENSMVKGLAAGIVKANAKDMQLPPYTDSNPGMECMITAADVAEATYKDNGDGTATIKIVPISCTNSRRFEDAQGKMFNVMEDVKGTVDGISMISWAEGDVDSNVVLTCDGGYAEVTYNKDTKMMTAADYTLITIADVQHANVAILKNKSATATFDYKMLFPGNG